MRKPLNSLIIELTLSNVNGWKVHNINVDFTIIFTHINPVSRQPLSIVDVNVKSLDQIINRAHLQPFTALTLYDELFCDKLTGITGNFIKLLN